MVQIARTIKVEIVADPSRLKQGFRQASASTNDFARGLERTTRGAIAGTVAITGMGRAIAFASAQFLGGYGLLYALTTTIKSAMEFQQSMVLIQTQAGGTAKEVENMTKAVLKLAPSVGTSPNELAKGLYHIESSGITGTKAIETLRISAQAAKLGVADLEQVINGLVGAEISGIKGTENLSRTMGILDAIIGSGNLRMEDLAKSLSSGIVPVAKSFGLTLEDVGAALTTLTVHGIPAVMSANRLRTSLTFLAAGTPAAERALKSINLTTHQLGDQMRTGGLVSALQLISEHLKRSGFDATEQVQIISRAFGGAKAGSTITILLNYLDQVRDHLDKIKAGAKTFQEKWQAEMQTAAFKTDKLKASVETLGIFIGSALLPTVGRASDHISTWLSKTENQKRIQEDLTKAVEDTKEIIIPFYEAVNQIQKALGGWGNTIKILVALKFANTIYEWGVAAKRTAIAFGLLLTAQKAVVVESGAAGAAGAVAGAAGASGAIRGGAGAAKTAAVAGGEVAGVAALARRTFPFAESAGAATASTARLNPALMAKDTALAAEKMTLMGDAAKVASSKFAILGSVLSMIPIIRYGVIGSFVAAAIIIRDAVRDIKNNAKELKEQHIIDQSDGTTTYTAPKPPDKDGPHARHVYKQMIAYGGGVPIKIDITFTPEGQAIIKKENAQFARQNALDNFTSADRWSGKNPGAGPPIGPTNKLPLGVFAIDPATALKLDMDKLRLEIAKGSKTAQKELIDLLRKQIAGDEISYKAQERALKKGVGNAAKHAAAMKNLLAEETADYGEIASLQKQEDKKSWELPMALQVAQAWAANADAASGGTKSGVEVSRQIEAIVSKQIASGKLKGQDLIAAINTLTAAQEQIAAFNIPVKLALAQAWAATTSGQGDDIKIATQIKDLIMAQIKSGKLKGAALQNAVSQLGGLFSTIRNNFNIPMKLQLAAAKAATTTVTTDDKAAAQAYKDFAEAYLKSKKRTAEGMLAAYNAISSANQTLGEGGGVATAYKMASTHKLTADLGLTRKQRVTEEQRIAQMEAHGGRTPKEGWKGVMGFAVNTNPPKDQTRGAAPIENKRPPAPAAHGIRPQTAPKVPFAGRSTASATRSIQASKMTVHTPSVNLHTGKITGMGTGGGGGDVTININGGDIKQVERTVLKVLQKARSHSAPQRRGSNGGHTLGLD